MATGGRATGIRGDSSVADRFGDHSPHHRTAPALSIPKLTRRPSCTRSCGGRLAAPRLASSFDRQGNSGGGGISVSCHLVRQVPDRQLAGVASGYGSALHAEESPGWGPWSMKEGVVYAQASASALRQVLALRVHLDDWTEHHGPLRVLRGSHKVDVLSHEEMERMVPETAHVECGVRRGGVLAMRPLLIHSSSKSHEHSPRRVLHIEYAASIFPTEGLELAVA